jgi:hypothetical protein
MRNEFAEKFLPVLRDVRGDPRTRMRPNLYDEAGDLSFQRKNGPLHFLSFLPFNPGIYSLRAANDKKKKGLCEDTPHTAME